MKFCPRCESMMRLVNKRYLCECGMFDSANKTVLVEKSGPRKELDIVHSEINTLAVHNHVCSKCGFDKAQLVSKGIFVSDEDEMTEYVCGKCGNHDPEEGLKA